MIARILSFISLFLLLLFCQPSLEPSTSDNEEEAASLRIVSLNGMTTELLYNLGFGAAIVGVDVTSTYPKALDTIPHLGHITQINAESLLALQPDVIIADAEEWKRAPIAQQLETSSIQVIPVDTKYTLSNAVGVAQQLAESLAIAPEKIESLKRDIEQDSMEILEITQNLIQDEAPKKVLFIYARGAGNLMVAGTNTAMSSIIELAGGENIIHEFEGFKALTSEFLVAANPDVILMFESGLNSMQAEAEGLAQIPGITKTKAYQNQAIIAMDGHFLSSFGPRVGQAVVELASAIYKSEIANE